eukprot:COSAG05_NODE_1016_length_6185_cov_4.604831_7_plen_85_part_00
MEGDGHITRAEISYIGIQITRRRTLMETPAQSPSHLRVYLHCGLQSMVRAVVMAIRQEIIPVCQGYAWLCPLARRWRLSFTVGS